MDKAIKPLAPVYEMGGFRLLLLLREVRRDFEQFFLMKECVNK
jgi:hypothetical protein